MKKFWVGKTYQHLGIVLTDWVYLLPIIQAERSNPRQPPLYKRFGAHELPAAWIGGLVPGCHEVAKCRERNTTLPDHVDEVPAQLIPCSRVFGEYENSFILSTKHPAPLR